LQTISVCEISVVRKKPMICKFSKQNSDLRVSFVAADDRCAMATPTQRVATVLAALLVLLSLALPPTSMAIPGRPGTLDATWATNSAIGAGKRVSGLSAGDDFGRAIVIQPDGKVVLVGACASGGGFAFCAARYTANGELDTSFANTSAIGAGKVITQFANLDGDEARAVALQDDGKIVLAGQCWNGSNHDFCALRYHANGTLDTSFAPSSPLGAGKLRTAVGAGNDRAYAVLVQPDGKIVLAGQCENAASIWEFCALRYLANGALDTSFAPDGPLGAGKLTVSIGGLGDQLRAAALQVNGRLVFGGHCYNGVNEDFCVARVNSFGGLDGSFATFGPLGGGKIMTDIALGSEYADVIAMQADGAIVLAGNCTAPTFSQRYCVARYNADGEPDVAGMPPEGTRFHIPTRGVLELYKIIGRAMLVQPDGKIVIAGSCNLNADSDFCLRRLSGDGSIDLSFSDAPLNFVGGDDSALTLALQSDGKVIAAGQCNNGLDFDFCIARFEGGPFGARQCSLDIDGDGKVLATTDALIYARIALGITGNAVFAGINFPAGATRTSWTDIRSFLISQCGMRVN
jgi:uncharacterized delta-60 repeat protein